MGTADAYPTGPIRIVVGVPEGGPLDIAARLIAPWLTERLGQTFQVENLIGDHSNLAARAVRDAAADGRTLLLCGPIYPINNALNPDLDFVFTRDFAPVAGFFRVPLIVISPYAKAKYISKQQHDFGSILKFIEGVYSLPSLGYADSVADDLSDCFDFNQTPLTFQTIQAPLKAQDFLNNHNPPTDPDDD